MREDSRIKKRTLFSKQGIITYGVMLLLVGGQVGIVVFPAFQSLHGSVQVSLVMLYWATVAGIFTWITNRQIKEEYEDPMRKLKEATGKVANGDFSIYVEPRHTADKYDYIDVMFLDFNKMIEELGSIETLKNDFISSVSHELKTPLAVIRNYSVALQKENLSLETKDEYLDTIIGATDRLSALISNILRLNKLDNQVIESVPVVYNFSQQLVDCILQFEHLWEAKSIQMIIDIEEETMLCGDEDLLEIVWNNLLSNAIKFTEAKGEIAITLRTDENSVLVAVSDSGVGMTAETLEHIFDKFYQGDSSHAQQGNGLGLALVWRIVEKAGGNITVESKPGKGSIFTVRLPKNLDIAEVAS